MTGNNKKSYLDYLSKLVDEYNNTYHYFIDKLTVEDNHSALNEEIEINLKSPKFEVGDRARITKYKHTFSKGYTENWPKEIFSIDSVLKPILGRITLKI